MPQSTSRLPRVESQSTQNRSVAGERRLSRKSKASGKAESPPKSTRSPSPSHSKLPKLNAFLAEFYAENIQTWFDLTLYLDKIKDTRKVSAVKIPRDFQAYKRTLLNQGIAFITFEYIIDGVTVEISKYVKSLEQILATDGKTPSFHFISGKIAPAGRNILSQVNDPKFFTLDDVKVFDQWSLYHDFFFKNIKRGNQTYNRLITELLSETLAIIKKLGAYLEEHSPALLYLVNVGSNPGNIALTLAIVLLSEYFQIPVINNAHDYYFEDGNRPIDIKLKRAKPGMRDFFFTNSHVGEVFSLLEVLFPWEAPHWLTLNINNVQCRDIIGNKGHHPLNVYKVQTAISEEQFKIYPKHERIQVLQSLQKLFQREAQTLSATRPDEFLTQLSHAKLHKLSLKSLYLPTLLSARNKTIDPFAYDNVLVIQPTRILRRKNIEATFTIFEKFFAEANFIKLLKSTPTLKLTLLVTGPVSKGHDVYLLSLIKQFAKFLTTLPQSLNNRVLMGFLFGNLTMTVQKIPIHISIPRLYSAASLITLMSETEGRGLPIIEANAAGVSIITKRYQPIEVYQEVIGRGLPDTDVLHVVEFDGAGIHTPQGIQKLLKNIFNPQSRIEQVKQSRRATFRRYSFDALATNLEAVLTRLHLALKPLPEAAKLTEASIIAYKQKLARHRTYAQTLLPGTARAYLPGYHRLEFMITLKSLIDPSFFRVEEQTLRGLVFTYALNLIKKYQKKFHPSSQPIKQIFEADPSTPELAKCTTLFLNCTAALFTLKSTTLQIQHDHSLPYRHRSFQKFHYMDFTYQELTGIIHLLYTKIFDPDKVLPQDTLPALPQNSAPTPHPIPTTQRTSRQAAASRYRNETPHFFSDLNLVFLQLSESIVLSIDHRNELIKRLDENVPIAYFPSEYFQYEIEIFGVKRVCRLLNLSDDSELNEALVKKHQHTLPKMSIFVHKMKVSELLYDVNLETFLKNSPNHAIRLLYRYKIITIVRTEQLCVGFHLYDMGRTALSRLIAIKEANGFMVCVGEHKVFMTDYMDIDRFHIGCVHHKLSASIMGIPSGTGFVLFIGAGLRTTLFYPTPLQTAHDYATVLASKLYKRLEKRFSRKILFQYLRAHSLAGDTPLAELLTRLEALTLSDPATTLTAALTATLAPLSQGVQKAIKLALKSPLKAPLQNSSHEKQAHSVPKSIKTTPLPSPSQHPSVTYRFVSGVYKDKMPWCGVLASASLREKWHFFAHHNTQAPKPLPKLLHEWIALHKSSKSPFAVPQHYKLAWNGGYILNPELIGKLGLKDKYIGSPLGLIIHEGRILSLPLFNKPALFFLKNGGVAIEQVSLKNGFTLQDVEAGIEFTFTAATRNCSLDDQATFYDLHHDFKSIPKPGHVIVHLAGTTIKEVITNDNLETTPILPVGVTLAIPRSQFPKHWATENVKLVCKLPMVIHQNLVVSPHSKQDSSAFPPSAKADGTLVTSHHHHHRHRHLSHQSPHQSSVQAGSSRTATALATSSSQHTVQPYFTDMADVAYAVEAGPLLIAKGTLQLKMIDEGWKREHSIRTQAARTDYTHMRGPKIAVGLSADEHLLVLAVNGRIRESVGATYKEMAEILLREGAVTAMGFDPGGSSTLYVNGKILNISPYHSQYEANILSLPPEPRFLSTVIGLCSSGPSS